MIRIVIAEEQPMLLYALEALLNLEEDMKVVGQASNGEEAITLVHELKPDICIMDIDMSGKSGLEVTEELYGIGCKVILLATFAHKEYIQRILEVGVAGYLMKDSPSEILTNSIRAIMAGSQVFEPELMEELKDEEILSSETEIFLNESTQQPTKPIETVKAYFFTFMDKIKQPTG